MHTKSFNVDKASLSTEVNVLFPSVAAGLGFGHVEQPDPIQSSGWTRISVQPEKFVCDGLNFFEFGLFNPRIDLTDLLNPRVWFEHFFETRFYDQTSRCIISHSLRNERLSSSFDFTSCSASSVSCGHHHQRCSRVIPV